MASQKNFAITPSVSISRSKFRRPSQHKTSFNLGSLVPIYMDADILPGDTVSLDLASLIRMSTPIAPIMDNIFVDYYAFFVPNRITWIHWKEFMGENSTTAGIQTTTYNIPQAAAADLAADPAVGSLFDYCGLPLKKEFAKQITALPFRALALIYDNWFRDQNLIAPLGVDTGDSNRVLISTSANYQFLAYKDYLKAAKESDYFTRALPFAQKGAPVSLPLGSTANLKAVSSPYSVGGSIVLGGWNDNLADGDYSLGMRVSGGSHTGVVKAGSVDPSLQAGEASKINLVADLSNATAATINQLRFAFQYQKFLEKDAMYGSRYWEILKGHFGITAPDASLQRPELLGHFRQHINVDQVLQTSETSTTALGTPGANSVSGKSEHLISKSFVEHGCLIVLAVARHEQTYGQGINRMWTRKARTDFYFPVFANLGAQEIKNKEIYAQNTVADDQVFGYQEAWAEYRYKPSIVTGLLNPSVPSSLGFWDLANNFGSLPTLSQSFIEQDRTNLARALVTGVTGPDFIADFYFDAVYVRPMPMYSIPGLIDHH